MGERRHTDGVRGYRRELLASLAAAATGGVGDAVAGANLDTGLGVGGGLRAHALLDLSRHGQESLLDVGGVLGRGLEEWDAE